MLKKYETLEKIPEIFYKSSEETTERISEFKKKNPEDIPAGRLNKLHEKCIFFCIF